MFHGFRIRSSCRKCDPCRSYIDKNTLMFPLESLISFLFLSRLFFFLLFSFDGLILPRLFCFVNTSSQYFSLFLFYSSVYFLILLCVLIILIFLNIPTKIPTAKKAGTLHFYSSLPFSLFIFCCNWSGSLSGWSRVHRR